jgi:hypothetical protein
LTACNALSPDRKGHRTREDGETRSAASIRNIIDGIDKNCRLSTAGRERVMAEVALFIGWGDVADGREKRAIEIFYESMKYWERLQQEGRIERFDVAVLTPNDRDLRGFVLLRGTAEQIDSLGLDEEFQRLVSRVQVVVDRLGLVDAFVDEGLSRTMRQYEVGRIGELG